MSGCGSCSSCDSGACEDKAQEYINGSGYSAIKCPFCGHEIVLFKMPDDRKMDCAECDTVIKIIPMLLN